MGIEAHSPQPSRRACAAPHDAQTLGRQHEEPGEGNRRKTEQHGRESHGTDMQCKHYYPEGKREYDADGIMRGNTQGQFTGQARLLEDACVSKLAFQHVREPLTNDDRPALAWAWSAHAQTRPDHHRYI